MLMLKRAFITSPISFLLIITFLFGLITFLIHSSLFRIRSSKAISIVNSYFKSQHDFSDSKQHELTDLARQRLSYLTELKKIEARRTKLLKAVENLKLQFDSLSNLTSTLKDKNLKVRTHLAHNTLKLDELNNYMKSRINSIQIAENLINTSIVSVNIKPSNTYSFCTIETCIDMSQCKLNAKLNIFIYEHAKMPEKLTDLLHRQIDSSQINMYANLITDINQLNRVCIVLVFLINDALYQRHMITFVNAHSDKNFLFIDTEWQENSKNINLQQFANLLSSQIATKSFFASLQPLNNYHQFRVHFSFVYAKTSYSRLVNNDFLFKRLNLLSYHQAAMSIGYNYNTKLQLLNQTLATSKSILFELSCRVHFQSLCFSEEERLRILSASTFTLLVPEENASNQDLSVRLVEALRCSTVPVLLGLDTHLPLEHLINWSDIVIRVSFSNIYRLIPILSTIDKTDIASRQIKARKVYVAYFSTPTNQLRTLISAMHDALNLPASPMPECHVQYIGPSELGTKKKVSNANDDENIEDESPSAEYLGELNPKPMPSQRYARNFSYNTHAAWNTFFYPFNMFPSTPFEHSHHLTPPTSFPSEESFSNLSIGGGDGHLFHHRLGGNFAEEQFTIVMLAYKRETILIDLLEKYVRLPHLHSIIVVWNALGTEISQRFKSKFHYYLSAERIRLVQSSRNSLCNRFLPYEHIETDAVLSLDDDMYLRADEITLAFRVWRENRDRVVGFPARYHTYEFNEGSQSESLYKSHLSCEYSMVLTGAAFYHRFYNYLFTYGMDERVRAKVDELMNCEDIAFNMLVAHVTRRPPLKVSTKYSFYCRECDTLVRNDDFNKYGNDSAFLPVSLRKGHYEKRTACLRYFAQVYGYNPLLYSQYRADSVLYRTRTGPDVQKCFRYV